MALIKCVECGKEISDKANACIHCRCPIDIKDTKSVCSECGKEISNKVETCIHCGCPIVENNQEEHYLIKCKVCGNDISNSSKVCIHCGEPLFKEKIKTMKKKKWEELHEKEKIKIIDYRKTNHLYWDPFRIVIIIVFFVLIPLLFWSILTDDSSLGIVMLIVYVGWVVIMALYHKIEEKKWYESHIDELYENDIIK